MFHYFVGDIVVFWNKKFLKNANFWIEVFYEWKSNSWEFFIFPHFDTNINTFSYLAFDNFDQKVLFENIYKIPWLWLKVSYHISNIPYESLKNAIETFDIKFFQTIPWVWPKTAKRIALELKNTISEKDISKLNVDDKLYKDIISSLKTLWYETSKVKKLLERCDLEISKENTSNIIKWVIDNF